MSLKNNARYTAVARGMTATFDIEARKASPFYPNISTIQQSTGADEAYAMLGKMPGMREWLGDRQFKQIRSAEMTLKNKHWESSLEIERTDIDDDRLGFLSGVMGDLADEATCHPDTLLFDIEKSGETNVCWDGQFFYDTDHVWGDSGTQSNILTYNAADANNVTPAEINDAFHQAMIRMMGFKRDNGEPWIRPKVNMLSGLRLGVPTALYQSAFKAFNQPLTLETGAGAATTQVVMSRPEIDAITYLDASMGGSDTVMDLHYTGGRIKPFLFQLRQALRRETKGIDTIEDKAVKFMTEARYNVGYLAWFYSIRIKFT